ncbi:hypothetical protein G6F63_016466 [Rhizopus arrhizus]|nr:hypothetical protein G6F63_016466 [Rhizopus arrhizus]
MTLSLRGFNSTRLGYTLDGVPLGDWDEAALRRRVALIGQKPQLLAGSIADNIRLGRPGASDTDLREAARRASGAMACRADRHSAWRWHACFCGTPG